MLSLNYIWPIALVVLSNIVYQLCTKETPSGMNPLASLTITYLIGAIFSGILYFILNKGGNLFHEYSKINWAPIVLGFVIVGLEVGFIYAYKAGWQVGTASIVQSSVLTIALLIIGCIAYHESFTWNKGVGILVCLVGLIFINMK